MKKKQMMEILNIKIDKIRINGIGFFIFAMSYIYISIFIFLIGWIKPIFSIPISIGLLITLYKYYKKYKANLENIEPIYMSIKLLFPLIVLVFTLGWILGWTGFAIQAGDFIKHNSILQDLTNKSWPVFYENSNEKSMLTYYIGQYIMPATLGKLVSSASLTLFFNGIWLMVGLLIAIIGVLKIVKANTTKKQIVAVITVLLFSVCTFLSQTIGNIFIKNLEISSNEWFMFNDEYKLQYSSNITLLRWVTPQVIVPWIVLSILYDNLFDIEHYVILCIPILFYSSFPFLGIICFLIMLTVIYLIKNRDFKVFLKNVFSVSNVVTIILLGSILLVYFSGNILAEKPDDIKLQLAKYSGDNILVYICFIISFLPYTLVLFKNNKKNPMYWMATAILLILPLVKMGLYNDFCMRVSIIPLFIYNILAIELLIKKKDIFCKLLLVIILAIGSVSTYREIYRSYDKVLDFFVVGFMNYSLEGYANRGLDIENDLKYNYYTYDLEESMFYKYLSRKQI